jgi:hypothetical protein
MQIAYLTLTYDIVNGHPKGVDEMKVVWYVQLLHGLRFRGLNVATGLILSNAVPANSFR